MAALCRLAVASFLFGAALYVLVRSLSFVCRLTLAPCAPTIFKWRFGMRLLSLSRGIGEAVIALLVASLWVLFLYAAAEGVPRLFSFFLGGAGAFLAHRLLGECIFRLEQWLDARIRAVTLWIFLPMKRFLLRLLRYGHRLASFFAEMFIKRLKGIYTKYVAYKYEKRAPSIWCERRITARLTAALEAREDESG